jgi:serine O-acetyltransferase
MPSIGSYLDADWSRLQALAERPPSRRRLGSHFSPRFAPVSLIRLAHALYSRRWTRCSRFAALVNFVVFGIEVPPRLEIGPGLVIMHTQGTVLGAASIGANVTIYQQVTLGARTADFAYTASLRPVVEDGVTITAGAKVLGALTLGRGSLVGANAVVLRDVPPNAVAVGVPARFIAGGVPAQSHETGQE